MPRPTHPNEWWGIVMTKVLVDGFGWAYIVLVVDWYTKRIVGYDASMPCTDPLTIDTSFVYVRHFRCDSHTSVWILDVECGTSDRKIVHCTFACTVLMTMRCGIPE